ncbi:MAG: hypothetical protein LUD17_06280 [Bacteroidales bacterium]|nr:hypothetical protein [Bacteroidales bacterium]
MDWTVIISILGAIGGLEGLRFLLNRSAEKRAANAKADTEVFHSLKEYNEFLQQQLNAKEERFQEQTQLVRKLQAELIGLTNEKANVELQLVTLRCEYLDCPWRKPPNASTPPPPGISRDEWHKARLTETAKDDAELFAEAKTLTSE